MNFISPIYGLFLLISLGIYWSVGNSSKNTNEGLSRKLWIILIVSLTFYASLQAQYIPLLLVITLINFRLGKSIGNKVVMGNMAQNKSLSNKDWQLALDRWNRQRQYLLWIGIFLNVLLLL
ncbi:MAG TPA: hypothetical protein V6D12_14585, partial [Candidatus Obscuribacterales bacterium]